MLLAGLLSIFGLIVWKVADLQVLNPGHYLAVVTSQTVHTETLAADRGSIYDRNRNELALTVPGKTVFADPKLITDVAGDALKLSPLLGIPVADLIPKLSAHNQFDYLARKIAAGGGRQGRGPEAAGDRLPGRAHRPDARRRHHQRACSVRSTSTTRAWVGSRPSTTSS